MSSRIEPGPVNSVSPQGAVVIQARLEPGSVYEWVRTGDFTVPPFSLVFGVASTGPRRRWRERTFDVVSNVLDFSRRAKGGYRFVGVSYEGLVISADDDSDRQGRFAVIVSGAVSILCDREQLDGCDVGDFLEYDFSDSGLRYYGLPDDFCAASVKKYEGGDTSRVFGMLLEKNMFVNEVSGAAGWCC